MQPEAQWYLAEALASARAQVEIRDDYEGKRAQLSHFSGVLAGFRYLGAVSQDEEHDWFRRMLVALGYAPPDPSPPGVGRAIYVGDPDKLPPRPPPRSAPVFLRSQPGPDEEFEVHGGKLRVIALEFYDSAVSIRWRVSPQPDIESVFPEEMASHEQDLIGLEQWAAEELRKKSRHELAMTRLYKFGLTDDLGTSYVPMGSRHGSGPQGMVGEAEFASPPPEASRLVFSWLGLEIAMPIA